MTGTIPKQEDLTKRRMKSLRDFSERAYNPTCKFWEGVFSGRDSGARFALLCNPGIRHLSTDPEEIRCMNNETSAIARDVYEVGIYDNSDFRMAGAEVYMHHVFKYPKQSIRNHIRMMRINWGKNPRIKNMVVTEYLYKKTDGNHVLTLLEESSQTWLQQPIESTHLPQPGRSKGLSFNLGPNTAQSIKRAAVNICHLSGRTDKEDYDFTYERLLAHMGNLIGQSLGKWESVILDPRQGQTASPTFNEDIFTVTNDQTSPFRIDRLAIWFNWDLKAEPYKFNKFLR